MTAKNPKIAIVAADFNKAIIDVMVNEAKREAESIGAKVSAVIRVPGCYELPLAIELQFLKSKIDIVIAIGYIERGETQHGEVMGHVVHQALVDMQIKYVKPIGIGIIGPGATPAQAEKRKVNYARAAVRAAMSNWQLVRGDKVDTPTSAR